MKTITSDKHNRLGKTDTPHRACEALLQVGELKSGGLIYPPWHSPSTAANPGNSRAPCLSGFTELRSVNTRVVRGPRIGEERRGPALAGEGLRAAFLLDTFLWRRKEKYLGPGGGETGKEFRCL